MSAFWLRMIALLAIGAGGIAAAERPEGNASASPTPAETIRAAGAQLVELYAAECFFEGPLWNPAEGKLYFTAFFPNRSNQQILRLEGPGRVTVWMDRTEGINGTIRDRTGWLVGAQVYGHRVVAIPLGGEKAPPFVTLAADPAWNQPNDVCMTPSGHIYFTDPDFAKGQASAVYHLAADGAVRAVARDLAAPNGLITANDGRTLYVADSRQKLWKKYPIQADGTLGAGEVFFNPDTPSTAEPDGLTIDARGNVYCAGRGGVWVVRPDGSLLEFIAVPQFVSNLTFGGPTGRTLFLTCKGKVYSLELTVEGGAASGRW